MAEVSAPLEQFVIKPLIPIHVGSFDISYTNSALLMTIIVALIMLLLVGSTSRAALVPSRLQSLAELSYEFVSGMVRENVGTNGIEFFPLVFSIFMFVLFANFIGLIPYSFTVTGQIVVTFALALFVFLLVTLVGLSGTDFTSSASSFRPVRRCSWRRSWCRSRSSPICRGRSASASGCSPT